MKKRLTVLLVNLVIIVTAQAYAGNGDLVVNGNLTGNGNLNVNGTINAGTGGVKFPDGSVQGTAAFPVLSSGTATPGTNAFDITIPATTSKFNLTYTITSSADNEPVMIGFNDNLTATGVYAVYTAPTYAAISGKVHAGYARTAAGSGGEYNNFNIIPSGKLIIVMGDHLSELNGVYWDGIFKDYLKYASPQTITKINMKCYNAGTKISSITWKIVAVP